MEPKLSISLFSSNVLRENLKSMNLNFKPTILTAIAQFLLNHQKWTRNEFKFDKISITREVTEISLIKFGTGLGRNPSISVI